MSGDATIDSAVEAVKLGAIDYLTKPFDFSRLRHLLTMVREEAQRRQRLLQAEQEVAKNAEFCGMVGRAPVMQEMFGIIRRLAPHVRTVLVTGETGSGKELVARALHRCGPRASRRFVAINCSAVVESLFESELFGHVRGAFTGATDNKPGLFEIASERNAVPRRDRRASAGDAGEAAARAGNRRGAAGRFAESDQGRRARDCGHSPRSARGCRSGALPQRSVLPSQRCRAARAVVGRAPGRYSVPDLCIRARFRCSLQQEDHRADAFCRAAAGIGHVERQCARAQKRRRTRVHPRRQRVRQRTRIPEQSGQRGGRTAQRWRCEARLVRRRCRLIGRFARRPSSAITSAMFWNVQAETRRGQPACWASIVEASTAGWTPMAFAPERRPSHSHFGRAGPKTL